LWADGRWDVHWFFRHNGCCGGRFEHREPSEPGLSASVDNAPSVIEVKTDCATILRCVCKQGSNCRGMGCRDGCHVREAAAQGSHHTCGDRSCGRGPAVSCVYP